MHVVIQYQYEFMLHAWISSQKMDLVQVHTRHRFKKKSPYTLTWLPYVDSVSVTTQNTWTHSDLISKRNLTILMPYIRAVILYIEITY